MMLVPQLAELFKLNCSLPLLHDVPSKNVEDVWAIAKEMCRLWRDLNRNRTAQAES